MPLKLILNIKISKLMKNNWKHLKIINSKPMNYFKKYNKNMKIKVH